MDPRLQRLLMSGGLGAGGPQMGDQPQVDTAEQVYISSLALLKMLKHGKCVYIYSVSRRYVNSRISTNPI